MSSQNSEVGNVVSELLQQAGDLIDSVTNDENMQLRVVFNESEGSQSEFESVIDSVVDSLDSDYDVDFIDADGEYLAVVSLE